MLKPNFNPWTVCKWKKRQTQFWFWRYLNLWGKKFLSTKDFATPPQYLCGPLGGHGPPVEDLCSIVNFLPPIMSFYSFLLCTNYAIPCRQIVYSVDELFTGGTETTYRSLGCALWQASSPWRSSAREASGTTPRGPASLLEKTTWGEAAKGRVNDASIPIAAAREAHAAVAWRHSHHNSRAISG